MATRVLTHLDSSRLAQLQSSFLRLFRPERKLPAPGHTGFERLASVQLRQKFVRLASGARFAFYAASERVQGGGDEVPSPPETGEGVWNSGESTLRPKPHPKRDRGQHRQYFGPAEGRQAHFTESDSSGKVGMSLGETMRQSCRRQFIRIFSIVTFVACSSLVQGAQVQRGFVDQVYQDESGEHKYVVFVPHDYTPEKQWPVILFLHGSGERGADGKRQARVGLGKAIRAREKSFPCIVVFPQVEDFDGPIRKAWWATSPNGKRALEILDEVEKRYRTDKDRVYLTGFSMGGFGTWNLAFSDSERWAAIAPICGGGDPTWAAKMVGLPIWAFHGLADRVVPVNESYQMVQSLRADGGNPMFTTFPGVGHNSWDSAYAIDSLYTWLLRHRRGEPVPEDDVPSSMIGSVNVSGQVLQHEEPFVPAVEIPDAIFLRLGNDMLSDLGDSLPHVVPPDALRGTLPDMQHTTSQAGRTFQVWLSDMSYDVQVNRVMIEAKADDRVTVTLAVRATISIGRVDIWGSGRSAATGPMDIVLGHRSDLAIAMDVRPVVKDRRLQLELLETRFRIPRDNWVVGDPEWVSTQGLGMTRGRVIRGLREGFYSDPGRIENEVIAAVPKMIRRLEEQFQLEQVDQLVGGLWPFPAYSPRLRAWPSAVRTDGDGLTLLVGVTQAAWTDEQAKAGPKLVRLKGTSDALSIGGRRFQFGLAPGLMGPLSEQMIGAGAARLWVEDMPLEALTSLADVETLGQMIPDLKNRGDTEVRTELMLASAVRLEPVALEGGDALQFELPKVVCSVKVHPEPGSKEWVPYVNIEFSIRHVVRPELHRRTAGNRSMSIAWLGRGAIDVDARFAPGYAASDSRIDTKRIRDIIAAGWHEWTELGPMSEVQLEDLDLGFAKLRAEGLGWQKRYMAATFGPAGVLLRNFTGKPVAYQIKGPYSDWGGPYELGAGRPHKYAVASPVTCRFRANGQQKQYTLPAGSRFEFHSASDGEIELYTSTEALPDGTQIVMVEGQND